MKFFINLLRYPALKNLDMDGINRLKYHRELLVSKPMLRRVFKEFHHKFNQLDELFFSVAGARIELGAGIAPMRNEFPSVMATDVVFSPEMDMKLNAERMELGPETVGVFFGQNCFHHFSKPENFFSELNRVLMPGGGVVLLEPYFGPVAKLFYERLFASEGFDKDYPSWETPDSGPMNGANQALSYIVFTRDRLEFERKYPNLKIVHQEVMTNYLKYIFSGGLNFKKLMPDSFIGVISFLERLLKPFNKILGLHHVIVIKKS
jgi:SAM-dependent methyltransferase